MLRAILFAVSVSTAALIPSVALAEEVEERAAEASGGMTSPAMFGTGIVMGTAGGAGLIAGAYLFTQGAGSCDGVSRDSQPTDAQVDGCMAGVGQQIGGVVALVTGGALFLGGIPVLAVGASPRDDGSSAGARAVVSVTPGGAALTVAF